MKLLEKFTLKGAVLSLVLAFVVFGLWTCNTEDIDDNIPFITLSSEKIQATAAEGDYNLVISTNRKWSISGNPDWCSPSQMTGEGPATITLTCLENTSIARAVDLRIATTSIGKYLRVEQDGAIGAMVIYEENFAVPDGNTNIAEYNLWQRGGTGGASASYSGTNTSVRTSVASSPLFYPDASSGGNVFFGTSPAVFTVTGIGLPSGVQDISLTFGISKVVYTTQNVWDPFNADNLTLSYTIDGVTWNPITWEIASEPEAGSATNWALASAVISTNGGDFLGLRYTAGVSSAIRLDDIKLISGGTSGPMVNLSAYTWNPTAEAASTTINVTSNTSWVVTPDPTATDWCTVDGALSGTDNGSFTVNVIANHGINRSATITVKSADNTITRLLAVSQAEDEGNLIWYEPCGNAATATTIAGYTGWEKLGTGATNVEYSGTGTEVRSTIPSTGMYTNASGPNAVFFGAAIPTVFIADNITLSGENTVTLSFGISKTTYISGTGNVWDPFVGNHLELSYSTDGGTTWLPANWSIASEPAAGATTTWALASAVFSTSGASSLSIKFTCNIASVVRLDDMKLVAGGTVEPFLNVSTPTLSIDGAGESKSFSVTSNVNWTVNSSATWCAVSPANGSDNGAVTVTASPNTATTSRSATVTVSGTGVSEKTVLVTQDEVAVPETVVWATAVGSVPITSNTDVNIFTGWETTGEGAANVTYYSPGTVSARTTTASANYSGASGGNNVFFGGLTNGTADFIVANINVNGLTDATLTFGSTNNAASYNYDHLLLFYSYDGYDWTIAPYSRTPASSGNWGLCQLTINSIPANAYLYLLWSATTASVCRIDDMKLTSADSPSPAVKPVVVTGTAGTFTATGATVGGNSYVTGTDAITEIGVEYKIDAGAYTAQTATIATPFTVELTGLSPATTYTYRAYAKIASATVYGREKTFYTQSATPSLSVAPSSLNFAAAGEDKSFNITSSNTTWSISSSETWCTVGVTTGTGNSAVTVTASPNTATTSRSATITVSGTGGVSDQLISVTQDGVTGSSYLAYISLVGLTTGSSLSDPYVEATDGSRVTRVFGSSETPANLSYTNSSSSIWSGGWNNSGAAWVISTIAVTEELSGLIKLSFKTFGVAASPKNWIVQYSNDNSTWHNTDAAYSITQTATPGDDQLFTIMVDAANKVVVGGRLYIKLMPDPASTEAINGGTIGTANVNSRLATLITVEKTTEAIGTLLVSPSSLSFDAAAETKSFTVTSNVTWTATSSNTWFSISPSGGSNNGTVSITASANTATTSRSATVTVSDPGGANRLVSITQAGATSATTLAEWVLTGLSAATVPSLNATTGAATLSLNDGRNITLATNGSIYTGGWDGASSTTIKAWMLDMDVTSAANGDLQIDFEAYATGTAPANFTIEWSTDNSTWNPTGQNYNFPNTSDIIVSKTITVSGVSSKLYIRLRAIDTVSVGGGTVASGGNSRLKTAVTITKL